MGCKREADMLLLFKFDLFENIIINEFLFVMYNKD